MRRKCSMPKMLCELSEFERWQLARDFDLDFERLNKFINDEEPIEREWTNEREKRVRILDKCV
jgi:hypothetical protein